MWTKNLNPQNVPKQRNGFDCGIFSIMAMKRICAARDLDYDQDQVTNVWRAWCTLECVTLQLSDMEQRCLHLCTHM
jgi:Ulp1 family protease